MKLAIDQYAHLASPIHRWEQRSKLLALFILMLAFAFVQQWQLLPAMFGVTAVLFATSRLPLSFLLARLRYPGLFIVGLAAVLPFAVGETVLFDLGWLNIKQEGCLALLVLATRFTCILTLGLIAFSTAPFLTSVKAMRSLGIPEVMVDMTLLAYRYLETLGDTLATMQRAMKLRGFKRDRLNRRNIRKLAGLAGTLLIRSYEQSERVYRAMILRGYGSRKPPLKQSFSSGMNAGDASKLFLLLLVAVSFVAAELVGFGNLAIAFQ